MLGSFLLTEGVFELLLAFRLRPLRNWTWVLGDGIITLLLGGIIWFTCHHGITALCQDHVRLRAFGNNIWFNALTAIATAYYGIIIPAKVKAY